MKRIKFFAVAACLAISSGAFAQFTNTGSRTSTSSSSVSADGWSTIWAEWNPLSIKHDEKNVDDESATGLSLGYSQAFSVTSNMPLFLEVGFGLQYSFNSKDLGEDFDLDDEDYELMDPKLKTSLFSAKVPVNLMYAFQIPNSSVTLLPFAGATLRYNISGKNKLKMDLSDEMVDYLEDTYGKKWEKEELYYSGLPLAGYDHDVFDKKDMGGDKNTWNRFQIGWQIGLKARLGQSFIAGVSYGTDFSELAKKTKMATTSITLGYAF